MSGRGDTRVDRPGSLVPRPSEGTRLSSGRTVHTLTMANDDMTYSIIMMITKSIVYTKVITTYNIIIDILD